MLNLHITNTYNNNESIVNVKSDLFKITESEKKELIEFLSTCNMHMFEIEDIIHFTTNSVSARYDFVIENIENNFEGMPCYTIQQIEEQEGFEL